MKKKLKVLVIFDTNGPASKTRDFTEELKTEDWKTERHVLESLKRLGHEARPLGIYDDIRVLTDELANNRPDIVFNLLELFLENPVHDRSIVGLFELFEIPYTGAGPVGLTLCKNKGLTKKILDFHRIKSPPFAVYHRGRRIFRPKKLAFPIIIKPLREEASYGISQNSLVFNEKDFRERILFVHESMKHDAIAEQFIVGRELYVSLLGNRRVRIFPIREMVFKNVTGEEWKFATYKAKWDEAYRKHWGIENRFPDLPDAVVAQIESLCKRATRHLQIRGYGRIDIRLTEKNEIYLIEANPNPFLARDEDFALSAKKGGLDYDPLVEKILRLGLQGEK